MSATTMMLPLKVTTHPPTHGTRQLSAKTKLLTHLLNSAAARTAPKAMKVKV